MEELTKLLTPIIENSVKHHIENIANRISENFKSAAAAETDFNSNRVDNECGGQNTRCGTLAEYLKVHLNEPATRVQEGSNEIHEGLGDILKTLGVNVENSDANGHSNAFLQLGCKPTTLQDYYIGMLHNFNYGKLFRRIF